MNNEIFQQAQTAYNAKDYASALQLFSSCMPNPNLTLQPGETGLLYHQIGNCLMKLGNNAEAINAYSQATVDMSYGALGAVNCNMGFAYAALRDYENAINCFKNAAQDSRYNARYKANLGMGNALLKLGKTAEAGVAFRESALDEKNPDPTKALLNLGICFMTLNRPADAVTSYESALQFPMKAATKNKLHANLGQAYVACGQMQKAVNAFEQALADKTYFLSDSASVDYQLAIGNVAQGTMEIPRQEENNYADASGFDVVGDSYDSDMYYSSEYDPGHYDDSAASAYLPESTPDATQDAFFNATDEEVENWSRSIDVQKKRRRGLGFKIFITLMILVVLALGSAVFIYTQGYGYPTQETVITQFFANPTQASESVLVSSMTDRQKQDILSYVVSDSDVQIEGVNRSMSNSTAYVTAQTDAGGSLLYEVSLVRDGIGWKISTVDLYFTSQN